MMQAVVLVAGVLMGTSLAAGAIIAAAVLLWAREPESALWWIRRGYDVLVGLMPVALWLALYFSHTAADYAPAYKSPLGALWTTLQGALVGSVLGAGPVFLTVMTNLPVIVVGFDAASFSLAVREAIVWSRLSVAVGAATISAVPLGLWAHYAGNDHE